MYYCDAHIHLLPNMDNGPSLPDAVQMFRELKRENFRQAIATPHYDPEREDCRCFIRRRREKYHELLDALHEEASRFHLLLSAEVRICPGVSRISQFDKLCIPGTPYLPVEFPLGGLQDWMIREISTILHKKRLQLIVCNLERYYWMYSRADYDRLCSLPHTVYQIGATALLNAEFYHEVLRLLFAKKTLLLGSNAHSMSRPPITSALVNKITNICGGTAYPVLAEQTVNFFRPAFS